MNVACNHRVENLPILFVDFNQDFSSIQVGTKSGYSLLSTAGEQITESISTSGEPTCIVGRLFNRSLVTLVTQNDMRKLLVSNSRTNALICHYRYTLTILAVKMNHQRLVVCVEDGIFIHNIRDMQMMHRVEETPPNRNGVLALSTGDDNCYLAYPGSHRVGTVFIFDALNFQNVTSIAAHDGLLAALAFNARGNLLATASDKGTVIRVFSVPQGDKLVEFRRGLTRCVAICCLNFSLNSQYLVAASHTETVHVFKLEQRTPGKMSSDPASISTGTSFNSSSMRRRRTISSESSASQSSGGVDELDVSSITVTDEQQHLAAGRGSPLMSDVNLGSSPRPSSGLTGTWGTGLVGWVGNTLKAYSSYLPHQVSEIFTQDRAFVCAHLPTNSSTANSLSSIWTGNGTPPASNTGDLSGGSPFAPEPVPNQPAGMHKVAAVVYHQSQPRLIIASLDGLVHTFAFDPVNGGEATLLRTQRLLSPNPHPGNLSRQLGTINAVSAIPQEASEKDIASGGAAGGIAHLTGSPQQPGVYVASANTRSPGARQLTTTFASVVAAGAGAHLSQNEDTGEVGGLRHCLPSTGDV